MSESTRESGVREVVIVSSGSKSGSLRESECRRLCGKVRSIRAELSRMVPTGAKKGDGKGGDGIKQYLERPDGHERALQKEQVIGA